MSTGGKQYVVSEKQKVKVEKLEGEAGTAVQLKALLTADGDSVTVGTPEAGTIEATIVRHGRTRKVTGIKYQAKTRRSTGYGHRQQFTELEIAKI